MLLLSVRVSLFTWLSCSMNVFFVFVWVACHRISYYSLLRQTSYIDVGDIEVDPLVLHLSNRLDNVLPVREKRTDFPLNLLIELSHFEIFLHDVVFVVCFHSDIDFKTISKQLR